MESWHVPDYQKSSIRHGCPFKWCQQLKALYSFFCCVFKSFFKVLSRNGFLCISPPWLGIKMELPLPRVGRWGRDAGHRGYTQHHLQSFPSLPFFTPQELIRKMSPLLPTPTHNHIFLNQLVIMENMVEEPRCWQAFMLYCRASASHAPALCSFSILVADRGLKAH